jgi:hypothetical protein
MKRGQMNGRQLGQVEGLVGENNEGGAVAVEAKYSTPLSYLIRSLSPDHPHT